jgi:hypothetical protein
MPAIATAAAVQGVSLPTDAPDAVIVATMVVAIDARTAVIVVAVAI